MTVSALYRQRKADSNAVASEVRAGGSLASYKEALHYFERARESLVRLSAEPGESCIAQIALQQCYRYLSQTHLHLGQLKATQENSRLAQELSVKLAENAPTLPADLSSAAPTDNFAIALARTRFDNRQAAASMWRRRDMLKARAQLAKENPSNGKYQANLAQSYTTIGTLQRRSGQTHAALNSFQRAKTIYQALIDEHPDTTDHLSRLGDALGGLAAALSDLNRHEEALSCLEEAIQHIELFKDRVTEAQG